MSRAFLKGAILCATLTTVAISGCSSDDDDTSEEVISDTNAITGLVSMESVRPVGETMGALQTALSANEAITALPLIDHQANASGIGEILRPTSVQLFGNPALGTPLMQVNQLAGLDLPQKMLAWEDEDGVTHLAYNSADYLQQRHAIEGSESAMTALETIGNALNALAGNAAGNTADEGADTEATEALESDAVSAGEGILTVTSTRDMQTTYRALITAIENNEALQVFTELDHSANAQDVELELDPTRLVIFGNPNAGTPLMQSEQTIGIDLPQKMLVFEDVDGTDSVVTIAYNDPNYLAARHGITGQDDRLAAIDGLLATLANEAAGIVAPE